MEASERGGLMQTGRSGRMLPAGNIEKIWLLDAGYGRLRMEILFDNRDYSSIELHDFSIIRTAATAAVDIPIVRDRLDGMAFPAFR